MLTYPELAGLDSRGKHREPKRAKVFDAVTQDVGLPSEAHNRSRPAPPGLLEALWRRRDASAMHAAAILTTRKPVAGIAPAAPRDQGGRGGVSAGYIPFFPLYHRTPYLHDYDSTRHGRACVFTREARAEAIHEVD